MIDLEELSKLKRYPHNDLLKAWDAADELALEELDNIQDLKHKKILILNDSFGFLSIALKDYQVTTYTDSYVSYKGMNLNGEGLNIVHDLEAIKDEYDIVLFKIPKNLSFFEDILCSLNQNLNPGTPIIFCGMVKYMVNNQFDLIQKYIGETRTSMAKKKARLIFSELSVGQQDNPYPQRVHIEEMNASFINHSNLFSRNKLDIGTRFFLENIPRGSFNRILDLGCANGIVGIKAKQLNPDSEIVFTDDSYMAIKSAKENFESFSFTPSAIFNWTNCYEDGEESSIDLVLCNPPFHQNHTVGDYIAMQMFKDARRTLRKGGVIRVIGNSHLGYQQSLKRIFGNSKIVATNKKFMIIDALKN